MDSLPLIPKSKIKENNDASHVIREVFQNVLSGHVFPKNIADNVEKYNVEHEHLKKNGNSANLTRENLEISLNDVSNVETEIMYKQGKYLIEEDVIVNNYTLNEKMRLKRYRIFEDLEEQHIEKYGLLQKIDLLPSKPERSMDFRINSNRHLCPPPCPYGLDLVPKKLKEIKTSKLKMKSSKSDEIFKAEPKKIVFYNYEINKTYKKKLQLRNISKTKRCIMPAILPKTSCFTVELISPTTRVAPGMSIHFVIKFKTDTYKDVQETVAFNTYTGSDVTVLLQSYRNSPNLRVYVLKTFRCFTGKINTASLCDIFDDQRSTALNSTIDCGSCLLGDEITLSLIMKNEGGDGEFFFITENDWYFSSVNAISDCMELTLNAFQIVPVYFAIEENEFVEVIIKFFPLSYGLQTEKLFMLCNNSTYEELEIVGDGVLFENYFIKIEMPKKESSISYMDSESKYYAYLGSCLPFSKQVCTVTVSNTSCVELQYRWKVRKSVSHIETTTLKVMDESWIKIKPESHQFPPDSTTDFEMIVATNTLNEGQYSIVLALYIEKVPEASLAEDIDFTVIEKEKTSNDTSKFLDILIGEIELACLIQNVHLLIEPPQMIVPVVLNYQESITKKLQLRTNGEFKLKCKWILVDKKNDEKCSIIVAPKHFDLYPKTTFVCEMTILPYNYEDIQEKLILYVNGGIFKKEYYIMASVQKPQLKFSCTLLNFGYIPKGTDAKKIFYVENLCHENIHWRIIEFTYDFAQKELVEVQNEKQLNAVCGSFNDYGQKYEIEYYVEGKENHRWFSFLMLFSSHPTQIAMDSICFITYEVCQPNIIIQSPTSESPILCPTELLYLGITTTYDLCLQNVGNLTGYFLWGKPVGTDVNAIHINCQPRAGIIQSEQTIQVILSLTPLQTGIFEHIYLPCFVGRMNEPIMLTIMCAVDDIHVNFFLPDRSGNLIKVLWPLKVIGDYDYVIEYNIETESKIEQEDGSILNIHPVAETSRTEIVTTISDEPQSVVTLFENRDICGIEIPIEKGTNSVHTLPSFVSTSSTLTGTEKFTSTQSLVKCFKSDLILQENIIEVYNLPLKTPIKKTFSIQNLTPIIGNYKIEAINFAEEIVEKNIVDDTLVKMKVKQRNDWEEMISRDCGIVIKPKPSSGELCEYGSVEIDLWIYANTWGVYVEEILIEINDITPFCFTLLIQAVGIPVEFPMAKNTIQEEPIVRFGPIPYMSDPITRKIKVKNTSSIPLCILWHIFIQEDSINQLNKPFSFLFDIFDPSVKTVNTSIENLQGKLMITEYFGKINKHLFQITPRETNIDPKSTITIELTLNSTYYSTKLSKTELTANLTGHVYIDEQYSYQPNCLNRLSGAEIPTVKAKVLATLELPLLKLDLVGGVSKLKVYANNIILEHEKHLDLRLMFQNRDKSNIVISMHTSEPFKVVCLKTLEADEDKYTDAAVVKPDGCVEVIIDCYLNCCEILEMAKMIYENPMKQLKEEINVENYSITLRRCLNIHQKGILQQVLPLQLIIFYPHIEVMPNPVNFGTVFVGNTKKSLLTIRNLTGAPVGFEIHKPYTAKEFIVQPTFGEVAKATGQSTGSIDLTLYFTPNNSRVYQEVLHIITNIPNYYVEVILTGTGTHDEKYYSENI